MTRLLATGITAALATLAAAAAASASSTLTLRVTAPPHFAGAVGSCPANHVADTVTSPAGAVLGELDGCFQTFELLTDGGDVFTATYTFDLRGGRISTSVVGRETPTPTGLQMDVTGTVTGGSGLYAGASGTIAGGGPVDFTSGIHPDLTFVVVLS
jgi:hypothetical protein